MPSSFNVTLTFTTYHSCNGKGHGLTPGFKKKFINNSIGYRADICTLLYLSNCHICCTNWWVNEGHTCPVLFPAISSLRHFDRRQLWTKNTEQAAKLLRHTHTHTDISIWRVKTASGIRLGAPDWHTLVKTLDHLNPNLSHFYTQSCHYSL